MAGVMGSMEACVPALRRYARSLLRDRQEVDDLVHDCLVRALDQLHMRRDDGYLAPGCSPSCTICSSAVHAGIKRGVEQSLSKK